MITSKEQVFRDRVSTAKTENMKHRRFKVNLKTIDKNVAMVMFVPKNRQYVIGKTDGTVYKTTLNPDENQIINGCENDEGGQVRANPYLTQDKIGSFVKYIGAQNIKKMWKKTFMHTWIGDGVCYGVNAGEIYEIGDTNTKRKIYEIRAWGDTWWDKRFNGETYYAGAGTHTTPFNWSVTNKDTIPAGTTWTTVDTKIRHFKYWENCFDRTNVENTVEWYKSEVLRGEAFTNLMKGDRLNPKRSIYPFMREEVNFNPYNSHMIMRTFRHDKHIDILMAYDNNEEIVWYPYYLANVNRLDPNNALYTQNCEDIGLTTLIWRKTRRKYLLTREYTRTNVPAFEVKDKMTTLKDVDNHTESLAPYTHKDYMKYPGVLISDRPTPIHIGYNPVCLYAMRTTWCRYGTDFTIIEAYNSDIVNVNNNKLITTMSDKIDFETYTRRMQVIAYNAAPSTTWNGDVQAWRFPNQSQNPVYEKRTV